ncbi:MAG: Ig-like domain-containing protein, partial [Gemmatimonadales bacterium]
MGSSLSTRRVQPWIESNRAILGRSIRVAALLALTIACNDDSPTASDAPVVRVSVTPATATLVAGDSLRMTATLIDANGDTLSTPAVVWSSSDAQVALIDQSGLVTAAAAGSATITATSDGIAGSASVSVLTPRDPVGFVGYSDVDSKLTACGECHPDERVGWARTDHARAWATLSNSGRSQPFCEGCHSVTERGNGLEGTVGYERNRDGRFHDVQCESCHGPGQDHGAAPSAATPLAPLSAGARLTTGCGECHRGAEQPHVEQWEQSDMSRVPNASIAGTTDRACLDCHEGRAALVSRFGESTRYVEESDDAP